MLSNRNHLRQRAVFFSHYNQKNQNLGFSVFIRKKGLPLDKAPGTAWERQRIPRGIVTHPCPHSHTAGCDDFWGFAWCCTRKPLTFSVMLGFRVPENFIIASPVHCASPIAQRCPQTKGGQRNIGHQRLLEKRQSTWTQPAHLD